MFTFPALPTDGEPTRSTLHAYALAMAELPRAHAPAHPLWWHISLKVRPDGLITEAMPLPSGGAASVRMDPRSALVVFETSGGDRRAFPMNAGLTATEMGNALIAAGSEFGLSGGYDRARFEDDDSRPYDDDDALGFFNAFVAAEGALAIQMNRLAGSVGPIQLWPHGFDLDFEWFGRRIVTASESGEPADLPAQINFGFFPAGSAYFYSNPWPFEAEVLLDVDLPGGAVWHTAGWKGSMLEYADLADSAAGVEHFLAYADAVFEAAAPTLSS